MQTAAPRTSGPPPLTDGTPDPTGQRLAQGHGESRRQGSPAGAPVVSRHGRPRPRQPPQERARPPAPRRGRLRRAGPGQGARWESGGRAGAEDWAPQRRDARSTAQASGRRRGGLTEALPHRRAERVPQEELHLGRTARYQPARVSRRVSASPAAFPA